MGKTFIMVKPDGVQRGLVGEVVKRFEDKGFQLLGGKFMQISQDLAKKHYAEHAERPFFDDLVEFITSGPVFAMVWAGEEVVTVSRKMIGATNPQEADLGTIRGDFGQVSRKNLVHGSDSNESAEREIALFFEAGELLTYTKKLNEWIY